MENKLETYDFRFLAYRKRFLRRPERISISFKGRVFKKIRNELFITVDEIAPWKFTHLPDGFKMLQVDGPTIGHDGEVVDRDPFETPELPQTVISLRAGYLGTIPFYRVVYGDGSYGIGGYYADHPTGGAFRLF